ncbi:MAG: hypothetical protein WCR76_05900 [Sphaerochaetaceae bacterium]
MKKKFVLVLALVLMVATAAAFAGSVNFSGRVRAGYVFTFGSTNTITPKYNPEGKINFVVADSDGLWTITYKSVGDTFGSNEKFGANITADVTKALAKNGIAVGDLSLKYSIGSNWSSGLTAYSDPNGNGYDVMDLASTYASSVTVGYGDLVTMKAIVDPTISKTYSVTALFDLADYGVKASIGYGNNVKDDCDAATIVTADGAFIASATVDIAKLANLDFKLSASAFEEYAVADEKNYMQANVMGGTDKVNGWVEYRQWDQTKLLNVKAVFNMIENGGFDAYGNITKLSDAGNNWNVGADLYYTLGGITYNLNGQYGLANGTATFAVTPKATIVW